MEMLEDLLHKMPPTNKELIEEKVCPICGVKEGEPCIDSGE